MRHFDLCIIGSGSGNTIADEAFSDREVLIVDDGVGPQDSFGGTCLNVGCIPTKMFVYPADLAQGTHEATRLGVDLRLDGVRWRSIRDRIFGRIDAISDGGRTWRASGMPNVTLVQGRARFVDERVIEVNGERIGADQFVLAVGSRPRPLEVPGAERVTVHTNETIMRLEELPESMVVLGGGYISAELAHVFAGFGVEVTLINRSGALLRTQDLAISQRFTTEFKKHVRVQLNESVVEVAPLEGDRVRVVTELTDGSSATCEADVLLSAIGRIPNGDGLDVEATGLHLDPQGRIPVDTHQRTPVEGIWALGDASSTHMLKHVANAEARTVRHNLLHPEDLQETDHRFVPWAVFSSPQVAGVGMTEQQVQAGDQQYVTATQDYADVAYGWAMEDEGHFCKLIAAPASHRLLGAHIIGPQASILIQPLIQAMSLGTDVETMATGQYWIHPALTEVVENALLALDLD